MNVITEAIKNLQSTSEALDKFANKPENYNAEFSHYLEVMSWEMHKQANELKSIISIYGV